jgi:hypothetical protein
MAGAEGMNAFAAAVMLYRVSVQELLELSAEARCNTFGALVGWARMVGPLAACVWACVIDHSKIWQDALNSAIAQQVEG